LEVVPVARIIGSTQPPAVRRVKRLLSRANVSGKPHYVWRPQQLLQRMTGMTRPESRTGLADVALPWGSTISCWPHEAIGSGLLRTGVHELAASEVLARLTAPGEFIVDAGANIGYMSALLAWRAGPSGRVLAFEPNPSVAEVFRTNSRRWGGMNWAPIEMHQSAISDRAGYAPLTIDEEFERNRGTASLRAGTRRRRIAEVQLERLVDAVGGGTPSVLKIDVEGHEELALRGAGSLVRDRRIRDIVFEEHRPYPTPVTRLLEQVGYVLFALDQTFFGPRLRVPMWRRDRISGAPNLLATADPLRTRHLLKSRGWVVLTSWGA
jgi:FkbM family methyltransferase